MVSPIRCLALLLALPACVAIAQPAPDRVQPEIVKLPLVLDGKPFEVVAHLYKPAGAGPFPLVIHSHGRAGDRIDRAKMQSPLPAGNGNYWVRRGVAVLAPVRPGYGDTGGSDQEDSGSAWRRGECTGNPDFTRTADNARKTVVATYQWALQQPWVRADRILLQGQSVGGLATVATSALNLPGVVGVVNFAGGAGGNPESSPGKSCKPDNLTATYRAFGAGARAPSLWLYAENDQYWGPDMPKTWYEAYRQGGSAAEMVTTAAVPGYDGHQLLVRGGRLWSVPLEAFIAKVGLTAP